MSKYLSEVRPSLKEGTVTALNVKDPVVKSEGNEEYWRAIYQNVARADVNRAQTKNLMFVYSKVRNYTGIESP